MYQIYSFSNELIYMFRTVFPSIIRSSRLYLQQYLFESCLYSLELQTIDGKTVQNMQSESFQNRINLIHWCIQLVLIIIIISNLSNDRSKTSSKTIPPHSAIQRFLLQLTVSFPVLKVIQQILTPSSSSSCHFYLPLYLSFSNLLQKAVST